MPVFSRDGRLEADKTIASLQEAVVANPNDTRTLLRLGEVAAKAGNAPLACEAYSRAGNIFLAGKAARRALGAFTNALQVAQDGGLADRVARIARAVWKLDMNEGLVADALGTIDGAVRWLVERGFDSHAVALFEARIGIEDSETVRLELAEVLGRLQQSNRAANELVTVFMRLHARGRRDRALEVGERVLEMRRDADIARACAQLYVARNGPSDALRAIAKLRICHEDDPKDVSTLELLARAFELAGHREKAERVRDEMAAFDLPGAKKRKRPEAGRPPVRQSAPTETSVISLSIADVELSALAPSAGSVAAIVVADAALHDIDSLRAQGRYDEALASIDEALAKHPNDPLLSMRKKDVERIRISHLQGPPPALFGPAGGAGRGGRKSDAPPSRGRRRTT